MEIKARFEEVKNPIEKSALGAFSVHSIFDFIKTIFLHDLLVCGGGIGKYSLRILLIFHKYQKSFEVVLIICENVSKEGHSPRWKKRTN